MTKTLQDRIEKIVEDIMQFGFDVAMGGDVFKNEEENKKLQEEKYNECVAIFSYQIKKIYDEGFDYAIDCLNKLLPSYFKKISKEDIFKKLNNL